MEGPQRFPGGIQEPAPAVDCNIALDASYYARPGPREVEGRTWKGIVVADSILAVEGIRRIEGREEALSRSGCPTW